MSTERPKTPADVHRLLPQSPDAEKGIVCSFLLAPVEVGKFCKEKGITPAHFHIPALGEIFSVLMQLWERQKPIDFIILTELLRDTGRLDAVGGAAFVTELFTFLPTAANAAHYVEVVLEKHELRSLLTTCTEIAARCYDEQDQFPQLLAAAELRIAEIAAHRVRGPQRLPGLCDLSTMLGASLPPPPPELVSGLLHQGSKLIIGGTSKGRKTFSLLDLAISVATGTKWWDSDCTQGRVCYINFEIQEPFFAKRTDDICRAKNVTLPPGMLMGWMLRGHGEGIELMVADMMEALLREKFALIIFDPIYKALGNRDENKAGDVASLCNELERIAVQTGAAIAFGAHYSKGNQAAKESIDRIGGSGVFARDPDAILTMTAHEREECFVVEATLRNFPPRAPFVVKWDWPLFRVEDADPAKLKQAKTGRTPRYTVSDLLELVGANEWKTGELLKKANEETGMGRTRFFDLLKAGESEGKITKSKITEKWESVR